MTETEILTAGRALADQLKREALAELPAVIAALEEVREGLI
jgi:hypothetical protein